MFTQSQIEAIRERLRIMKRKLSVIGIKTVYDEAKRHEIEILIDQINNDLANLTEGE